MLKTSTVVVLAFTLLTASASPAAVHNDSVGFRILTLSNGAKAALWYPSSGNPVAYRYAGGLASMLAVNAPIAAGRFPLVLFSHGFGGCSTQAAFFTEALAGDGYVVVAPDHRDATVCHVAAPARPANKEPEEPFRSPRIWSDSTYADRRDDLEVAISDLLRAPDLARHIDATRIAATGHSLGGYTALGISGAWPSWKERRIVAAVLFSPYAFPFLTNGDLSRIGVPLIYEGGTRDAIITPATQRPGGFYALSPPPKYFVDITGAGHLSFADDACRGAATVRDCSGLPIPALIDRYAIAFLDRYVKQEQGAPLVQKAPGITMLEFQTH
jgi:predicted dienelactone hydrolase